MSHPVNALPKLLDRIVAPDGAAGLQAQWALDQLTKPPGSLGRLGSWPGSSVRCGPFPPQARRCVIFISLPTTACRRRVTPTRRS
jgi:NaMN:DMB phosphoribosyltransferase